MQLFPANLHLPVLFFLALFFPDHLVTIFLIHLTKMEDVFIYDCIFLLKPNATK